MAGFRTTSECDARNQRKSGVSGIRPQVATLALGSILVGLFGAGCTTVGGAGPAMDPATSAPPPPPMTSTRVQSTQTTTTTEAVQKLALTKYLTLTDDLGHKVSLAVSFSNAMRASDAEKVDASWHSVGGTGPAACLEDRSTGHFPAWQIIQIRPARVWVGQLVMTNSTPDFDWPNQMALSVGTEGSQHLSLFGEQFSDGNKCSTGFDIGRPNTGATSARVAFTFVQADAYTPNSPDGVAIPTIVLQARYSFKVSDTAKFQLPKA